MHYAGQSIIVSLINPGKTLLNFHHEFMRLIHLTDPHLSSLDGLSFIRLRGKRRSGYLSWLKKRRFVHRPEILEQLTESVLSHRPDMILLTGDLVHIGLEKEMIEAADWLRRLGPPEKVMLVPGNHDNYAGDSLAFMYRHWGDYLPVHGAAPDYTAGFPVTRECGDVKLLGVNTSSVTRIFSAAGALGNEQQQRLERLLERTAGDERYHCLLIHHPPFPGMTRRRKALHDSGQLRDILDRHPPGLVLYGHIHCNREEVHKTTRLYCTASSSDHRNASYRVIDLEKNGAEWDCRMRLMSLQDGCGVAAAFSVSAESRWQERVY
jgi:3',5'-cyclic AMP phosphodiesterase CpdA